MFKELFDQMRRAKKSEALSIASDIRDLIILWFRKSRGENIEIDAEYVASTLDRSNLTEEGLEKNGARYAKRLEAAKVAGGYEMHLAHAAELYAAGVELSRKVHETYAAGCLEVKKLADRREEIQAAATNALVARNFLIDTSATSNEEIETLRQQLEVNSKIKSLREKTDPNAKMLDGMFYGENMWASVATHPAALIAQTDRALKQTSVTPARRAELERQRKVAEVAVAECKRELAAAEKEASKINDLLAEFTAAKYLPENFAIIRPKKSSSEGVPGFQYSTAAPALTAG